MRASTDSAQRQAGAAPAARVSQPRPSTARRHTCSAAHTPATASPPSASAIAGPDLAGRILLEHLSLQLGRPCLATLDWRPGSAGLPRRRVRQPRCLAGRPLHPTLPHHSVHPFHGQSDLGRDAPRAPAGQVEEPDAFSCPSAAGEPATPRRSSPFNGRKQSSSEPKTYFSTTRVSPSQYAACGRLPAA